MKINEVITKVDLTKRTIKFYEEKGFLKVKRSENGYREYSIPGFFGYYFLNHFIPYLQISIETKEQQEAYDRIIEFWDNANIKIPLLFKLNSWIMYKLYNEENLKKCLIYISKFINFCSILSFL